MKEIKEYSLLPHNTFGMDVKASVFVEYGSVAELKAILSNKDYLKPSWLHIGGGSNLLFTADYEGTVLHSAIHGYEVVDENDKTVDIMPSSRRGEGLGYYGMMNNTAMSIGPMVGLFLHNAYSFEVIFWCALVSCALGLVMASLVKTPAKEPVKREPISLDRFILLKGIPAGICLLLLSVPYGMTSNYIAMYSQQIGITAETGFFFTFMAFGMATSRLFSGRLVDRGKITQVIEAGLYLVCFCFFGLSACGWLIDFSLQWTTYFFFLTRRWIWKRKRILLLPA